MNVPADQPSSSFFVFSTVPLKEGGKREKTVHSLAVFGTFLYSLLTNCTFQISAARLVCRVKCQEHITPFLRSLHWFPVTQREKNTRFRCSLTRQFMAMLQHNLQSLTSPKAPMHSFNLRSSHNSQYQLANGPRTYTRYGQRAVNSAAPSL